MRTVGDIDGADHLLATDVTDFVVPAYGYMSNGVTTNGKVYVVLSGG